MRFVQFGNRVYNEKYGVAHETVNFIYSTLKYSFIRVRHSGPHKHPLCTSRRDLLVMLDHWVPFQLALMRSTHIYI